MSARKPAPAADSEETRLFREVIGLIYEAVMEDDRRRRSRPHWKTSPTRAEPVAAALARCAAGGDEAGVRTILAVHRPETEWRTIAFLLACAADPERIPVVLPERGRKAA